MVFCNISDKPMCEYRISYHLFEVCTGTRVPGMYSTCLLSSGDVSQFVHYHYMVLRAAVN